MRPNILPFRVLIVTAFALTTAACGGGGGDDDPIVLDPPPSDIAEVSEGAGNPPPAAVGIELPAPVNGVVVLESQTIPLTLRNASPDPVHAKVIADVQSNGAFNEVDVGTFDLGPGADREVAIALRVLGVNVDSLETPAGVGFRVVVDDPTGEPIDGFALPTYFVHRDGEDVVLYDEDVLIARYDGGDINGTFADPGLPDLPPNSAKIFVGAGAGDPDPDASPPDFSSGLQTICIHWKYRSLGHNAGEKYYKNAEPMAARGVKVTLGTQTLLTSRNNGCLAAAVPEGVFQIIVHAHAVIGNGHDIVIRAFELDESQENTSLPDSLERKWVFKAISGPQPVHIYVPADESSTMMAFGTFSVATLDTLVPVTKQNPKLDLRLVEGRVNSEADANSVFIAPSQKDIKFLYGHEVGHWYGQNLGFGVGAGYSVHSSDPDCASNEDGNVARDHLIRGTELHGAAYKEGLAHALSTFIWNGVAASAPRFRYYKDLDNLAAYDDLQADHYRIDMAARTSDANTLGGIRAWRSEKCPDSTNYEQESVELDWARFLVSFIDPSTNQTYGDAPTFAQLVQLLQAAQTEQKERNTNTAFNVEIYPILLDAVSDDFADRFTVLAEIYDLTP